MKIRHTSQPAQRGFSLVEILVSIVVLTFGVLGVLGLQLDALRGNQNASETALAVSLVRDYQEILSSVPSVAASSTTSAITRIDKNDYDGYSAAVECKGATANCTNEQFADFQVRDWIQRVQASLPNGSVTVCFDDAFVETSGTAINRYKWACSDTGDILVVKIGWEKRLRKDSSGNIVEKSLDDGVSRPNLVVPVTGNQEGYNL